MGVDGSFLNSTMLDGGKVETWVGVSVVVDVGGGGIMLW